MKLLCLVPSLFSLGYLFIALFLFASAPTKTSKCNSGYRHVYALCKQMDSRTTYFTNPDEHHFAGLLFAFLALACFFVATFVCKARFVFAPGEVSVSGRVSTLSVMCGYVLSAWAYALIVSVLLLAAFLLQAHGLASMLDGFFFEGGSMWYARSVERPTPLFGSSGLVRPVSPDPSPIFVVAYGAYAHSLGFYMYVYFKVIAWWGSVAAAPPLLYACLFRSCRITRTVVMPLLSSLWFCYLIVRQVLFTLEGSKSYFSTVPLAVENTVLHFELELVPQGYSTEIFNLIWSEFFITAAFSLLGLLGTLAETFNDAGPAAKFSCFVALVLPWMCYAQKGVFNNVIWGGNHCPEEVNGTPGALWFKATQNSTFDMLVIRLFLIQSTSTVMAYFAKLLTQDHLPLGISFPIKSSWLRFVLPAYFLAFWGIVGRVMQTSFNNPSTTVLMEALLVLQELVQVWAYMHQKGPLAYLLSLALARGSAKVSADAVTPEYRTLADIPSKAFTYNFLICTHTICEAVTCLVAGLIPLAYNYNISGLAPLNRSLIVTNMVIAIVGETLVADGLFCILAVRQQRQAHTFLATWQMRPRGSIHVFVATTVVAILPLWYAIILYQVPKKDDTHLGYHGFPVVLWKVVETLRQYNATENGVATDADVYLLQGECVSPSLRKKWCNEEVWEETGRWASRTNVVNRCCHWLNIYGWPTTSMGCLR